MRVLVTGANGFIGTHTVRRLIDKGHTVRGLVWPTDTDANSKLQREWGCEVVTGDFEDPKDAERVLDDMEAVVHLIGSIKKPDVGSFEQMHRAKTQGMVETAKRAGVKRIIYISAPGASATAKSDYLRTKFQAEEVIRASGLEWAVLRCSLVVGRRVGARDSKLVRRYLDMAKSKAKIPVLGTGENTLQPVHVTNLAEIIEMALTKPEANGHVFGVGGPEVLTMNQIVKTLLGVAGCPEKPLKHISMPVVKILANILPLFMKEPPVEKAQVLAMEETERVDVEKTLKTFPVELIGFGESVKDYLE